MRYSSVLAALCAAAFGANQARAQDCTSYPYTPGAIDVEQVEGSTKIVATGGAAVSFDDVGALNDARDEAQMEARAAVARFMTETIQRDESLNRAIRETRSMGANSQSATRNEVTERLKQLRGSAQALLRGVVPLAECYTRAREIRVTVGIKPETIAAAGGLAGDVGASVAAQPTPMAPTAPNAAGGGQPSGPAAGAPAGPGTGQQLRDTGSYSNTDRLRRF